MYFTVWRLHVAAGGTAVSTSCLSGRVGQTEEPGAAEAGLVTTDQHAGELFLPD